MNRPILISQLFYFSALFAISLQNPLPNFGAINNASTVKCGVSEPQGHYGFFPWMAYIEEICTGTIVGANWILTAGHCAVHANIKSASVYVGARDFEEGQQISIADVFPHPNFFVIEEQNEPFFIKNDIGLLKLKTPLEFNGHNLAPVCLGGDFEWGQKGTIAGWGYQIRCVSSEHNKMLIGQETLIKSKECVNADGTNLFDDPTTKICTKPLNAEVEHGDSGGPLMVQDEATGQWREIGIASYKNPNCSELDRYDPDIFTAVSAYCDWIKETTGGEVQCGI